MSKNEGAYQNEDEKLEYKMSELPRNMATQYYRVSGKHRETQMTVVSLQNNVFASQRDDSI